MSRSFTDKEAAEILQRAVQLQESAAQGRAGLLPENGISEEELRRIAQESGLDLQYLDLALKGGPPSSDVRRSRFDWAREYEYSLEGTFPVSKFDLLLETVGPSRGRSMGLRQVGQSIEGQIVKGLGFGRLRLTARDGRTKLFVRSTSFLPFMCFAYPGLLAALVGGTLTAVLINLWTGLGIAAAGLILGCIGLRLTQPAAHRSMETLTQEILKVVEAETSTQHDAQPEMSEPSVVNIVE